MIKKRMISWQLFSAYFLIMLLIGIGAILVLFRMNAQNLTETAKENLAALGVSTGEKIDSRIEELDRISLKIVTDANFIPTLVDLGGRELPSSDDINTLYKLMAEADKESHIYRIVAYSPSGRYVSYGQTKIESQEVQELITALPSLETPFTGSRRSILGPYNDPWIKENPKRLVTLRRTVWQAGELLGVLEVQVLAKDIEALCESFWNGSPLPYLLVSRDAYYNITNLPQKDQVALREFINIHPAFYPSTSYESEDNLITVKDFSNWDWDFALLLPRSLLHKQLYATQSITILMVLAFLAVMVVFFRLLIARITRPMYEVINQIQEMTLDKLGTPLTPVSAGYEVQVLSEAFGRMQNRLLESLAKEKAAEQLQTKALFESLQTQIGPHFLYNTLNSIAYLCEQKDTEAAANACFSLADILRYGSNYAKVIVSIEDELYNLENFLSLMKYRYRQRLSYTIHVDTKTLALDIPKLTLQPLVENAIKYSLAERETVCLHISIQKHASYTEIRVTDNGPGFTQEALEKIKATLCTYLADASSSLLYDQIKFGGMGLSGTLLRLYLHFGEQFYYDITQNQEEGSEVKLYLPPKEANLNVQGNSGR